jgi:protein SCO1/2
MEVPGALKRKRQIAVRSVGLLFAVLTQLFIIRPCLADSHAASGIVLAVDRPHRSFRVSCREIPGFMAAMVMDLPVRDVRELDGLSTGTIIDFTLVVAGNTARAESVRIHRFQSTGQEPMAARQLNLLSHLVDSDASRMKPLTVGENVPDFALVSQKRESVKLSQFRGKVVGITFLYTHCPLPNYCYRLSNNFGVVLQRFGDRVGRDLVLMSITFDPEHDQPDVLAQYARNWKAADVKGWYFLTGPLPEIQKVALEFGMDFWQDEGFLTHALHTVVLDREGTVLANLEGNEFTPQQLGDLFEAALTATSTH